MLRPTSRALIPSPEGEGNSRLFVNEKIVDILCLSVSFCFIKALV